MPETDQTGRDSIETYIDSVGRRLGQRGYTQRRDGPRDYRTTVFHRRKLSLTKFGFVDYFVVIAPFESVDPAQAEAFSRAAFDYGLSNKSALPRGLGGNLVVYPLIVGDGLGRPVHDWATGYRNKHWAAFEFPVVADLGTGELTYNRSKPLWGRAYYSGFQKLADTCLAPQGGTGQQPPATGGPPR